MPDAPFRLGFAGTPLIASEVLRGLCDTGWTPTLVLTQPDRRSGRGMRHLSSSVKQYAVQHGIDVLQPATLKDNPPPQLQQLDTLLVAAYGLILPPQVLRAPRLGCINLHFSLLPAWRGAAPIERAIQAGDSVSGLTLMQMDAGLDTGPILSQQQCALQARDTAADLQQRLCQLAYTWLPQQLDLFVRGELSPQPQGSATSYAGKISNAERSINWQLDAEAVDRQVRALFPTARTTIGDGQWLKVLEVQPHLDTSRAQFAAGVQPGTILNPPEQDQLWVACGSGAVQIHTAQMPGKKPCAAAALMHGYPNLFAHGVRLGLS